jgi:hypothetical protein
MFSISTYSERGMVGAGLDEDEGMKPPRKRRYPKHDIRPEKVIEEGCKKVCYPSKAKALKEKKDMSGRVKQTGAYLCVRHDEETWHLTSQAHQVARLHKHLEESSDE